MPPLIAFDERRWAEVAGYATMETMHLLAVLTLRRAEISSILRQLPAEAWLRVGLHEVRGPLSLLTLVQEIVAHEEAHCQQLEAVFLS